MATPMFQIRKLFQKLTYWDLAIGIVTLVLFLAFFFFFYRKQEYVEVRMKVTDEEVLYARTYPKVWYANRFFKGDVEQDALGRITSEITGVETFNVASDRKAVYLDLKIKASYDSRTKLYSFKGKTLVFGTPLRFNFSQVTFDGIVTEFPGWDKYVGYQVGTKEVAALSRNIELFVATSIKNGDKIYDSNGILLAEVLEAQVRPAQKVTQTDRGELLLRLDPLYKDVVLRLRLRTKTWQGEVFMFDDLPVKIGEAIPLNFERASIFPAITEIY
jgi:hypothetical protein